MRGVLLLFIVALFAGCAEYQTLEELELAALESGDWSAVEQREKVMEKRRARRAANCGAGRMLVCEHRGADRGCYCAADDDVRALLDSL